MTSNTVHQMVWERIDQYGDKPLLRYKDGATWRTITWTEFGHRVRRAGLGLCSLGVEPKDRVAILSENRPEWAIADIATLSIGCADAPIYATNTPDQVAYVIQDSGSKVVFVSDHGQLDKVLQVLDRCESLTHVVSFVALPSGRDLPDHVITLEALYELGDNYDDPSELERRQGLVTEDDLLTLIYTSGTTGEPKGVMLTHGNIMSNLRMIDAVTDIRETDEALSFLPLSHSFERTAGYYIVLYKGGLINYAESIPKLVENIAEVRPTLMCSVPRIFEKVYTKFMVQVEEAQGLKKTIMDWALKVGTQVSGHRERKEPVPYLLELQYTLAHKLVFSKLSDKLGGRIRFFVSGGAPLSGKIARFFHAAGMTILEGYGLTETAPVLTVNRLGDYKFGSVGKPVPGVTIKLAEEDGEILAKGANIMKGYYGKPEETREVLSEDGWFSTGDIGEFDENGFLTITDRKKDLIKTAGGKYIAPQKIENALKLERLIEQVNVIGDQRPYCIAMLVPDYVELEAWCESRGISSKNRDELVKNPTVVSEFQASVDRVNSKLARYETIKRFLIVAEPFSQENDQLTPKMSVRRKVVNKVYADQIDALYAQPSSE
ncbi:MAG: long-chain fatty acid--CoA ligase [Myxococcales bacterium]|nr:long-chain fatty acid--CoA ligase [Myxococcales bacterium]